MSYHQEVIQTNGRIKTVRKDSGLSQTAFGEKLGLSQNFIWMLENGQREPSDRTVNDICRVFRINEAWLRTGEGAMHVSAAPDDQIAAALADAAAHRQTPKQRVLRALANMPEECFSAVEEFIASWIKTNPPKE